MLLQSVTKYRQDGTIQYKENFNVFSVSDQGNGIARGQLSCGKLPYDNSKQDQALLQAGYNLDRRGYIRGNFFVTFMGAAYEKALNLRNGAIIEDVLFDNDPYPYVNKDGQVTYRNEPRWVVIDFVEKQFDNTSVNGVDNATNEENPFTANDVQSPMYQQKTTQSTSSANDDNYSEY